MHYIHYIHHIHYIHYIHYIHSYTYTVIHYIHYIHYIHSYIYTLIHYTLYKSSMITVSGGHDVKEEGDEKGGKKDLSMGQLGEALLMMQTSLQFSLPSGCPLVTLLTLLADQLCVDPARIAIYLTQNPVLSLPSYKPSCTP